VRSRIFQPASGAPPDSKGFSLAPGGPLFQLLCRAHLSDDALALVKRRIVVISLVAWLPLLVLSALGGRLFGGRVTLPFLWDMEVHIRFLFVIPLFLAAELVVHQRMRPLVNQFLERDLVPRAERARFDAAVASAVRARNSIVAEVVLIALVYIVGVMIVWRHYMSLDTATWYATPSAHGTTLSLAGSWYGVVSLPIYQFLLLRWLFRLFVWARFLWQVARIHLNLNPLHPDRAGGLGFLSGVLSAFLPLALAIGGVVAGPLADHIIYSGAKLTEFAQPIGVGVAIVVLLFVGPLSVFAPQIARAKRTGLIEYGAEAQRYVVAFDTKWLRGGAPREEQFLGSGDIQSLADLSNSFEVVRTMRIAPISRQDLVRIAVAVLVPIAPLLLTIMPLDQLLKLVVGFLR
jgi:hypothetical protein